MYIIYKYYYIHCIKILLWKEERMIFFFFEFKKKLDKFFSRPVQSDLSGSAKTLELYVISSSSRQGARQDYSTGTVLMIHDAHRTILYAIHNKYYVWHTCEGSAVVQ